MMDQLTRIKDIFDLQKWIMDRQKKDYKCRNIRQANFELYTLGVAPPQLIRDTLILGSSEIAHIFNLPDFGIPDDSRIIYCGYPGTDFPALLDLCPADTKCQQKQKCEDITGMFAKNMLFYTFNNDIFTKQIIFSSLAEEVKNDLQIKADRFEVNPGVDILREFSRKILVSSPSVVNPIKTVVLTFGGQDLSLTYFKSFPDIEQIEGTDFILPNDYLKYQLSSDVNAYKNYLLKHNNKFVAKVVGLYIQFVQLLLHRSENIKSLQIILPRTIYLDARINRFNAVRDYLTRGSKDAEKQRIISKLENNIVFNRFTGINPTNGDPNSITYIKSVLSNYKSLDIMQMMQSLYDRLNDDGRKQFITGLAHQTVTVNEVGERQPIGLYYKVLVEKSIVPNDPTIKDSIRKKYWEDYKGKVGQPSPKELTWKQVPPRIQKILYLYNRLELNKNTSDDQIRDLELYNRGVIASIDDTDEHITDNCNFIKTDIFVKIFQVAQSGGGGQAGQSGQAGQAGQAGQSGQAGQTGQGAGRRQNQELKQKLRRLYIDTSDMVNDRISYPEALKMLRQKQDQTDQNIFDRIRKQASALTQQQLPQQILKRINTVYQTATPFEKKLLKFHLKFAYQAVIIKLSELPEDLPTKLKSLLDYTIDNMTEDNLGKVKKMNFEQKFLLLESKIYNPFNAMDCENIDSLYSLFNHHFENQLFQLQKDQHSLLNKVRVIRFPEEVFEPYTNFTTKKSIINILGERVMQVKDDFRPKL